MDVTINPAFVIFSALSPILIAILKQQGFSDQANSWIAFGVYVVVGVGGVLTSGHQLSIDNVVDLITVAVVVGSAAYALFWNNLGRKAAGDASFDERLTAATSIVK